MRFDQKPLNPEEKARLQIWHRNMMAFYAVAMVTLVGAALTLPRLLEEHLANRLLIALILFLMVAGGWVQFRERCPRCNTRLGRQSRFKVPQVCGKCGVPLIDL